MDGKIETGRIVMTRGIAEFIEGNNVDMNVVINVVRRHSEGDWGDIPDEDWAANDEAVDAGSRIISSYKIYGETIWIITEAVGTEERREYTTLLFPSEY